MKIECFKNIKTKNPIFMASQRDHKNGGGFVGTGVGRHEALTACLSSIASFYGPHEKWDDPLSVTLGELWNGAKA